MGTTMPAKPLEKGAAAIVAEREVDADVPVIIVRHTKRALSRAVGRFLRPADKAAEADRDNRHERQNINFPHGGGDL